MAKSKKKRLWIVLPLCALLLCGMVLGVYFALQGDEYKDIMPAAVYTHEDGSKLPYRIYVPEGADGQETYPLVVYLHGAGSS